MPAEWAPQKRIWLSWPHNEADWPGKFAPIPYVFAEMVRLISRDQRVGLLVKDAKAKTTATKLLKEAHANLKHVDFLIAPTDRGWLRDCGPIWVKSGKDLVGLDWGFNAWAKYPNWKKDTVVPTHVLGFHQNIKANSSRLKVVVSKSMVRVRLSLPKNGCSAKNKFAIKVSRAKIMNKYLQNI